MMSMFYVVVRRKQSGGQFLFGAPLFLVWLVLAPIGILVLPAILLVSLLSGINPFPAFAAFCRMFASLKGTHVEVEDDARTFELRVA